MVLPGSTVGMLGGGQLGRMFVIAARTLGYDVIVLDPDQYSPAGSLATEHLQRGYDDVVALDYLARHCAVVTTEFENIPATSLQYLAQSVAVHPSASALTVAQDRRLEKEFFGKLRLPTADFLVIDDVSNLEQARDFSFPAILKTARLGYDGKGQVICDSFDALTAAFEKIGKHPCVLEQHIELATEVSALVCRSLQGDVTNFPIAENSHVNGILDVTLVPATVSAQLVDQAIDAAKRIADGLDYCGVLAVEFFITSDDRILVNEMAPRPHNSGHFTLDACATSQFEQQLRMICGLPAGSCKLHGAVAMWNLLGDIWPADAAPKWDNLLCFEQAKLHLYGKSEARPGRKMGHINCLGATVEEADKLLAQVRDALT